MHETNKISNPPICGDWLTAAAAAGMCSDLSWFNEKNLSWVVKWTIKVQGVADSMGKPDTALQPGTFSILLNQEKQPRQQQQEEDRPVFMLGSTSSKLLYLHALDGTSLQCVWGWVFFSLVNQIMLPPPISDFHMCILRGKMCLCWPYLHHKS